MGGCDVPITGSSVSRLFVVGPADGSNEDALSTLLTRVIPVSWQGPETASRIARPLGYGSASNVQDPRAKGGEQLLVCIEKNPGMFAESAIMIAAR